MQQPLPVYDIMEWVICEVYTPPSEAYQVMGVLVDAALSLRNSLDADENDLCSRILGARERLWSAVSARLDFMINRIIENHEHSAEMYNNPAVYNLESYRKGFDDFIDTKLHDKDVHGRFYSSGITAPPSFNGMTLAPSLPRQREPTKRDKREMMVFFLDDIHLGRFTSADDIKQYERYRSMRAVANQFPYIQEASIFEWIKPRFSDIASNTLRYYSSLFLLFFRPPHVLFLLEYIQREQAKRENAPLKAKKAARRKHITMVRAERRAERREAREQAREQARERARRKGSKGNFRGCWEEC